MRTHPDSRRYWYWQIQAKILRFLVSVYGDFEPPVRSRTGQARTSTLLKSLPQRPNMPRSPSVIRAILERIAALNRWRSRPGRVQEGRREPRPRPFVWDVARVGLIVLAIVALCIIVVHASISLRVARSKQAIARIQLVELDAALALYLTDCGSPPTTAQALNALLNDPGVTGWHGPYLVGARIPLDPWGMPFRYRMVGGRPTVDSAGPDLLFGTADDLLPERD